MVFFIITCVTSKEVRSIAHFWTQYYSQRSNTEYIVTSKEVRSLRTSGRSIHSQRNEPDFNNITSEEVRSLRTSGRETIHE